jgi:hypothetical protein
MATTQRYKAGQGQHTVSCVLSHYDSVAEMESDCFGKPMARHGNSYQRGKLEEKGSGYSWYGVASLAEVKRILKEGYTEGAKQVDELYAAIAPSLPRAVDYRRKRIRADQGDSLDIHAVNRGALDKAWETSKRQAQAGTGLVRIVVDICGNGHVSASQLQWRGIAALALSRAMVKAGYSVEIVAGQAGAGAFDADYGLHGVITVTVKPRYAAVDTATLAATVCLPGFFRYIGFASIIKQADDIGADACSGLGRAVKLETVLPVPEKISQVIVPETVNSRDDAVRWATEAVTLLQGATVGKENSR